MPLCGCPAPEFRGTLQIGGSNCCVQCNTPLKPFSYSEGPYTSIGVYGAFSYDEGPDFIVVYSLGHFQVGSLPLWEPYGRSIYFIEAL